MKRTFRHTFLTTLLVLFTCLSPMASQAVQDAVYKYPSLSFTPDHVKSFLQKTTGEQAEVLKALAAKYPDKPNKVAKAPAAIAYARIVNGAHNLLSRIDKGETLSDGDVVFMRLQRLHYSVLADLGNGRIEPRLKVGIKVVSNLVGGSLALDVPDIDDPNQPIGEAAAREEASRLYRKGSTNPVSVAELARMSALEVSRLSPIVDHPGLSGKEPGNNFAAFAAEQTGLIRAVDKDLSRFDGNYARRILFFDEIKADATSPKIMTKDRYGLTWKMKWGDEVHTDVTVSRLYMDIGGSFADLKFYSGPGETLLILDPPSKTGADAIHTFEEFAATLLKSMFKFHADRYLLNGKGKVDQAMIERESMDPKYLGATVLTFKECALSLYSPAIKRQGGTALSGVGALEDRVARSSMVFNTWVKNDDMKDENSRVGLVFQPQTGKFDRLVEYQSDLGGTMGSNKARGDLNAFEPSFVKTTSRRIGFVMRAAYIPQSWKTCTWADARWMALRVARLSRADLERTLSESGWPSFAQRVAVERLLSRRNELIKPFRLDLDGIKPIPCNPGFTLKIAQGNKIPVLLGKINADSTIVKELEATIHPEGLANVIPRSKD